MGRDKHQLVKMIEEQIRLREGIPRLIIARTTNMEFEAEREDFLETSLIGFSACNVPENSLKTDFRDC